jgi:RNA polymerase sigma factor (sigma-70 family)
MDRMTDHRLVAAFRAGDDQAFTQLALRYRKPLLRFAAQRLLSSAHDAEDVVQESLARAYVALRRDDRPMLLRPWLYSIVRNAVVDAMRAPSHSQLHDWLPVPDGTVADVLERCELAALVSAVAELPERQRRALVLLAFEGRPYSAIAESLETTVPATKALIARARAGVRDLADAA